MTTRPQHDCPSGQLSVACSSPICLPATASPVHRAQTLALQVSPSGQGVCVTCPWGAHCGPAASPLHVALVIRELWGEQRLEPGAGPGARPSRAASVSSFAVGWGWCLAGRLPPELTRGVGQLPWRCWVCSQEADPTPFPLMGWRPMGQSSLEGPHRAQQWPSAGTADPKLCHLWHTGRASTPPLGYVPSPLGPR